MRVARAIVALLPVPAIGGIGWMLCTGSMGFFSREGWLLTLWLPPLAAFLLELKFGDLRSRASRVLAYLIVLWGIGYLVLAGFLGPFFGPLPVRLVGFPIAALGWLPVAWLSLRGDQPPTREGRWTPVLFSLVSAASCGAIAISY
jgi:hypothetical protein